ncbi:MAG: hypothetical protein K2N34_05605 [Lachnospiraceae bacterium]|nr:hypothetical protein [Lachnospiraceae bacterium]
MLNKDGIIRKKYGAPVQILANVEHQYSVGCRVPASMGVDVGEGLKIVKAGTPITIDLLDTSKYVVAATTTCNAVLLHNVDVTNVKSGGAANGTALVWGFVNLNRVENDVQTKLKAQTDTGKVTLVKL